MNVHEYSSVTSGDEHLYDRTNMQDINVPNFTKMLSTKHNSHIVFSETKGVREEQEDAYCIILPTPEVPVIILGIFDGHGGAKASKAVSECFPPLLTSLLLSDDHHDHMSQRLHEVVHTMDSKLTRFQTEGCTAVIFCARMDCPIRKDASHVGEHVGYVISIGDSMALRVQGDSKITELLTPIHDVNHTGARQRIKNAKGKIVYGDRVNGNNPKSDGSMQLNLTNTLGDHWDKRSDMTGEQQALSCTPYIGKLHFTPNTTIILCCDGLTEGLPSHEMGQFPKVFNKEMLQLHRSLMKFKSNYNAHRRIDDNPYGEVVTNHPMSVADAIMRNALRRSGDNITMLAATIGPLQGWGMTGGMPEETRYLLTVPPNMKDMEKYLNSYDGIPAFASLPEDLKSELIATAGYKYMDNGWNVTTPGVHYTLHSKNVTPQQMPKKYRTVIDRHNTVWTKNIPSLKKMSQTDWNTADDMGNTPFNVLLMRASIDHDWAFVHEMVVHFTNMKWRMKNKSNKRGTYPAQYISVLKGKRDRVATGITAGELVNAINQIMVE